MTVQLALLPCQGMDQRDMPAGRLAAKGPVGTMGLGFVARLPFFTMTIQHGNLFMPGQS